MSTEPSKFPPTFSVTISDEVLADLNQRLKATRWAPDPSNDDWFYGVNGTYLHDLVDYWINEFDWRAAEKKINGFCQYRVEIDGVPIHFLHEPGKGPAPIPIILSHGWPWTFWHWSKVIRPLADPAAFGGDPADAFDVIVPSLPGFGFSTPLTKPDMNFWKMADLFNTLMTETLGFKKYAAGGSDYGALVTSQLGHKYASNLYGIHLGHSLHPDIFQSERPWDFTEGRMVPQGVPDEIRNGIIAYQRRFASHVAVHMLDSSTLAAALNDSPVGMLAWVLARWAKWSESHGDVESVYSRDDILTMATIYWVSKSIGLTTRAYANVNRYQWRPSHNRKPAVEAPTGITFLGFENPPGVTTENRVQAFLNSPDANWFNTVYLKAHEKGGHFTPWENPEAVIEDIRATFRKLR